MNDKIVDDKSNVPFITLEQWQELKDFVKSMTLQSGYATVIFYAMENIEKGVSLKEK